MELSRRDFSVPLTSPYLHYQLTTQQIKPASAVIPIPVFQDIGINTYFHQSLLGNYGIEHFAHRVYDRGD
jgi:hypothetical protein